MSDAIFQNLREVPEALAAHGLDAGRHREWVNAVTDHLRRYASLEEKLLGHVWISVPTHLIVGDLPADPMEAGTLAAHRERARWDPGESPGSSLWERLDREGLKVHGRRMPEGSDLQGFFLFDAEVGPVLVVDATLSEHQADFVLARLYAHYLLDHDPYQVRFALRTTDPEDGVGLRAQLFAAALLVDGDAVAGWMRERGHEGGTPLSPEQFEELTVIAETDPRTLGARLLSLGLVTPPELGELLKEISDEQDGVDRVPLLLSPRFVRLALEAHAKELISGKELALCLEVEETEALELASKFHWEEETKGSA